MKHFGIWVANKKTLYLTFASMNDLIWTIVPLFQCISFYYFYLTGRGDEMQVRSDPAQ